MSKEIDWSKAPEGATHFNREVEGKFSPRWFMQVMGGWKVWYQGFWQTATPAASGINVDDFVARPEPWTGQGLPPVGTVCEWAPWSTERRVVEILAYHGDEVWMKYRDHADNTFTVANPAFFYPIRTPEQIAAEDREKAVSDMLSMWMDCGSARDFCEYLHDHGYRKTEAGK